MSSVRIAKMLFVLGGVCCFMVGSILGLAIPPSMIGAGLNVNIDQITQKIAAYAFTANHFVPDIIPNEPKGLLEVVYNGSRPVMLGNEFTPMEVSEQPAMGSWSTQPGRLSTLVMIDPDITNPDTNLKELPFLHWLIYNIHGNDLDSGDEYAEYMGSLPPPGTGYHRYVFLMFVQQNEIKEIPALQSNNLLQRQGFNLTQWILTYQLGDVLAGNYFRCTCDAYCLSFWKSFNVTA